MLRHFQDAPVPKKKMPKEVTGTSNSANPPAAEASVETDDHCVTIPSEQVECSHDAEDDEGKVWQS